VSEPETTPPPAFVRENRIFHCRQHSPTSATVAYTLHTPEHACTCHQEPYAPPPSLPIGQTRPGRTGWSFNWTHSRTPCAALCRPKESNNHLSRCTKLSLHGPYVGCTGGSVRREVGGSLLCGRKSWCPIFGVEVGAADRSDRPVRRAVVALGGVRGSCYIVPI